jgi:hypothetical protein
MKKKIVATLACTLILIPIFSITSSANLGPELDVNITARTTLLFGALLITEIENVGDIDVHNVVVTTTLKHPLIKKFNFPIEETIGKISQGETYKVSWQLSWIGRFEFTLSASLPEGYSTTKTVRGFVLGRFIILFPQ